MLNFEKIKEKEPITIVGHENADLDSLLSAYFLSLLFSFKGISNKIKFRDSFREPELIYSGINYDVFETGVKKEDVLFLVDHYIPCENEVVGCIDHHPGACVFPEKENFFEIRSSSCAKIIFDLMLKEGMEETKDLVFKTIMSIYGDTLSLTLESKVVPNDKIWIKQKIEEYGFSESDFVPAGLRLTDINKPCSEVLKNKYKTFFSSSGTKMATSIICMEYMPDSVFLSNLFTQISKNLHLSDTNSWILVILCLRERKSIVCDVFKNNNIKINYYDKIVSRGRDILPKRI